MMHPPSSTVQFRPVSTPHARQYWATAIKQACQQTVDAIIATGQALISAKSHLEHGEFQAMIREDLPFKPRTAQCFMAIARDGRMRTSGAHLPPSWRTLVELSRLDDEAFQAGIETGAINPGMAREDAWKLRFPLPAEPTASSAVQLPAIAGPHDHATAADSDNRARLLAPIDEAHERLRTAFWSGNEAAVKLALEDYNSTVILAVNTAKLAANDRMIKTVEAGIADLKDRQSQEAIERKKTREGIKYVRNLLDEVERRTSPPT